MAHTPIWGREKHKHKADTVQTPVKSTNPMDALSLKEKMASEAKWLGGEHEKYLDTMGGAYGKYGDILSSLAGQLNDPASKVSFGLQGFDPISFVPSSRLHEMSTLESLAGKQLGNTMAIPLEKWGYSQTNTPYTPEFKYWDVINSLAQQEENRRYGIAGQTQTASLTNPSPDILTQLGIIGNLANTGTKLYDYYKTPSGGTTGGGTSNIANTVIPTNLGRKDWNLTSLFQ